MQDQETTLSTAHILENKMKSNEMRMYFFFFLALVQLLFVRELNE